MVYVCEFEFWESASGNVIAEPLTFDAEGTFGEDLTDAVESAADWLAMEVDDRLMSGGEMPPMSFGHTAEGSSRSPSRAICRTSRR